MKESICFITSYSGKNIEPDDYFRDDGCYGSEYSLLETAKRLTDDYNVFITIGKPNDYFKRTHGGINWIAECDYNRWVQYSRPKHIVVVRYSCVFTELFFPPESKIYYWLHDPIPLVYREGPAGFVPKQFISLINRIADRLVSVGNQIIRDSYEPQWGLRSENFTVIKNAVNIEEGWDPLSTTRRPLSFCFTTTPSRGLWPLLEVGWPMILEKFPQATLDLYYGYNAGDKARVEEFVKKYPSITIHGKVKQPELFDAFRTMEYWLYPCTEQETCCTTTFETAYYGPIQITNKKGALIENVSGFKFDEGPDFWKNVVETVESLESNPFIKKSIRMRQYKFSLENTWEKRVEQWKSLFKNGQ